MINNDVIIKRIAEALLVDYSSVCYVETATGEYRWFSINPELRSLHLEPDGQDFFATVIELAQKFVFEQDRPAFLMDMQKDRLLRSVYKDSMQSVDFRLMLDGKPVYHRLRLIREVGADHDYFILGLINIDNEMRLQRSTERLEEERDAFNEIAKSLATHYDTIYYVDMETDHYIEFSSTDIYKQMHVPPEGNDFFAESKKNVERFVHPDDRGEVEALHNKAVLLKNLETRKTFSVTYRLVIVGEVMHCRHFEMWAGDRRHVIICVENINEEIARDEALQQAMSTNVTYSQIAERLADRYDTIYYVDAETETYVEFSSGNLLQALSAPSSGKSFFADARNNIPKVVYADDQTMIYAFLNKSLLLGGLHFPEVRQIEYRLLSDGALIYVRLSAMYTKDQRHLLFCVENIDKQVRALNSANKLARTDDLTGAKNKNAYQELERSFQSLINSGNPPCFAVVVCDINNLKEINDKHGHQVGDACIKAASKAIGGVFKHSPLFRIGGDEFVVVLAESDYERRDELLETLRAQFLDNKKKGGIPVVASGMSVFDPAVDRKVSDVFARADSLMYECKHMLKTMP